MHTGWLIIIFRTISDLEHAFCSRYIFCTRSQRVAALVSQIQIIVTRASLSSQNEFWKQNNRNISIYGLQQCFPLHRTLPTSLTVPSNIHARLPPPPTKKTHQNISMSKVKDIFLTNKNCIFCSSTLFTGQLLSHLEFRISIATRLASLYLLLLFACLFVCIFSSLCTTIFVAFGHCDRLH